MLLVAEVFIAAVLLVIAYYKYSFQHWRKLNVPYVVPRIPWGNYPSPILRKINWGEVVTQMYNDMKRKGHKYFGIYLFNQPSLVLADTKYIKLFLAKDFDYFNYRNLYYNEKDDPVGAHLISLNGDKWKNMRNKLRPTFTTGKIKMVFHIFLECCKGMDNMLQEHIDTKTPFCVKDLFSSFSSDVIVNCAFGLEVDMFRKKEFSKHTKVATNFDMVRCLVMYMGAAFPELCRMLGFRQIVKSSADFFMNVVGSTVEYREKNKINRNDFLQLLINLKNQKNDLGEEFSLGEMTAQCFIFFLAGYETSAATMSLALYEIASHPRIYEKAREEIKTVLEKYNGQITYEAIKDMEYLEQIVSETLRLHSPAYSISRTCTQDYYFKEADIVLRKGHSIIVPIRALHTDPELYPDPLQFKPERFHPDNRQNIDQYAYLPFGEGPRICIGQRFALVEMKVALCMILRNYKFSVNSKTKIPLRPHPSTLLYDIKDGIYLNCEKAS